jgi:hypothetical protein
MCGGWAAAAEPALARGPGRQVAAAACCGVPGVLREMARAESPPGLPPAGEGLGGGAGGAVCGGPCPGGQPAGQRGCAVACRPPSPPSWQLLAACYCSLAFLQGDGRRLLVANCLVAAACTLPAEFQMAWPCSTAWLSARLPPCTHPTCADAVDMLLRYVDDCVQLTLVLGCHDYE